MRDLVLREGLKTMAGDASLLLRDLLESGAEIPYELRESGNGSALAEYVPQTSLFIRDQTSELARLDSFGTTCAALESGGRAASYLDEMGVPDPGDSRRRSELAGVVFLCRLWQGSTDFTLDDPRLASVVDEVLNAGEAALGEVEIAAPLRGFHMESERLELAGATIVRSDTVEVPSDARAGEGMGAAAWEPTFLLVTRVDALDTAEDGSDLGIRAVAAFNRVITTLRLFKPGGVALGPHAWVKSGGDRWRRIATGAGRPRPGGYRLSDAELGDLAALSRGLANPTTPFSRATADGSGFPGALARAISRFEAGLERAVTVEALNDYLLTLRFLLQGGGPASLGMSMRVAALCAEPDERTVVKETVDRAIALERELWSGEPALGFDRNPPAEVAAEVEDLTRAILRDAACGHLGSELRITADEILLGEGLSIGEGTGATERGETAEWDTDEPVAAELEGDYSEPALEQELEDALAGRRPDPAEPVTPEPTLESGRDGFPARAQNLIHDLSSQDAEPEFEWSEPAPRSERGAKPPQQRQAAGGERAAEGHESVPPAESAAGGSAAQGEDAGASEEAERPTERLRILKAVPDEGPVAALIADSDNHRRDVAHRVSFLFPRPETTEWSVREVGYDRTRRAEVDEQTTGH